jgi:hypothetical protein
VPVAPVKLLQADGVSALNSRPHLPGPRQPTSLTRGHCGSALRRGGRTMMVDELCQSTSTDGGSINASRVGSGEVPTWR